MKIFVFLILFANIVVGLSPVRNLRLATSGPEFIFVKWDEYTEQINGFEIEYGTFPQTRENEKLRTEPTLTSFNLTELLSGTLYQIKIRPVGKTSNEYGLWSSYGIFKTDGPKPPTSISITNIIDISALVKWTPSSSTVDNYIISVKNVLNKSVVSYHVSNTVSEYQLIGLVPSTAYHVRMYAVANGIPSSHLTNGFTSNIARPVAPTSTTVTNIEETSAIIQWVDPQSGKQISHFEVELNTQDGKKSQKVTHGASTQLKFDQLKPETYYTCKVRAVATGTSFSSEWSEETFFKTRATSLPHIPTDRTVTRVSTDHAMYQWTKPFSKYPIEKYNIEVAALFQRPKHVTVAGDVNSYVFSELKSGTIYSARVQAVVAKNITGLWSTVTRFSTVGPKPASSISITDITDKTTKVSWTISPNLNYTSIEIVLYDFALKENGIPKTIQKTEDIRYLILRDLKSAHSYNAKIRTVDERGVKSSEISLGFTTAVSIALLNAPTNPVIKVLDPSSLEFKCNKVNDAAVLNYQVSIEGTPNPRVPLQRIDDFTITRNQQQQSMIVTNLVSGYDYFLRVRAIFPSVQYGTWSTKSIAVLPGGRPPSFIRITDIDENSAVVYWLPGYKTQTSGVDHFLRLEGLEKKNSWVNHTYIMAPRALFFKLPDQLVHSSAHRVSIFSRKDNINGTATSLGFTTGRRAPRAPYYLAVHLTFNKTTITWQAITERPDIIYYQTMLLSHYPNVSDVSYVRTPSAEVTSVDFLRLKPEVVYQIFVRAVVSEINLGNSKGRWSTPLLFTPKVSLLPPEDINVAHVEDDSAVLTWRIHQRFNVFYYEVELVRTDRATTIIEKTSGVTNTLRVDSLLKGTEYQYKVRAIGYNGNVGKWSRVASLKTTGIKGNEVHTATTTIDALLISAIIAGILIVLVVAIISVAIYRRRYSAIAFKKFDASVRYSKKTGYSNGHSPEQREMDDATTTAIKQGNKLYV